MKLFTTARERAICADRIDEMAKRFGYTTRRVSGVEASLPRCTTVFVETVNGLTAMVDLWPADAVLIHWHGLKDPHKLARGFSGDVNPYHFHKATAFAYSADGLIARLALDLTDIQTGKAFQ